MAELVNGILDFRSWPSNFAHSSRAMADEMDLKMVIRIVTIVGAYCILRPYIVKFFARTAMKNPESLEVLDAAMKDGAGANDFRNVGRRKKLEDAKKAAKGGAGAGAGESSDEGEVTGADWGKKARKRQQKVVERKEREEEIIKKLDNGEADDQDVMDLLVDYEEGEDGW